MEDTPVQRPDDPLRIAIIAVLVVAVAAAAVVMLALPFLLTSTS
jgi:hypothetical protein